jgi:tRNA nucleotidyltransferase/poly(A) polymerase
LTLSLETLRQRIRGLETVTAFRKTSFEGQAYLVGGAIRELYLDKTPRDYDFALSSPDDLARIKKTLRAPSFVLGKKPIQTHRIVSGDICIDVTFLAGSIADDLRRRDFTMNAIAYDIASDVLLDPMGGLKDIEARTIRYPGKETIPSDPLRMLKAIRHMATLEGFRLDDALVAAIRELRGLIQTVAPERIKHELDQVMPSKGAYDALKIMEKTGLLFEIFPELDALRNLDREKHFVLETYGHTIDAFTYLPRESSLCGLDEKAAMNVGYALLFHDLGKAYTFSYDEQKDAVHFFHHERVSKEIAARIMERLRFSYHEERSIFSLIEHHMRIFLISSGESAERAVRRLVYKVGNLTPSLVVMTLCDMYGSSQGEENESTRRVRVRCGEVLDAYEEWKRTPLPRLVNGHDLMALGFQQGPGIGRVLDDIREKQISGEINERSEALAYARKRVQP